METQQGRSAQRPTGAIADQGVELVDRQCTEVASFDVRRTCQEVVDVGRRLDADGGQQADRLVVEATEGERQGGARGGVDPLGVVDGHQKRSVLAHRAESAGEGD